MFLYWIRRWAQGLEWGFGELVEALGIGDVVGELSEEGGGGCGGGGRFCVWY